MYVLIEKKLYPEWQIILQSVKNGGNEIDDATLKAYMYVFFPLEIGETKEIVSYGPLIYLCAYHQHPHYFTRLLTLNPDIVHVAEIVRTTTLLWLLMDHIMDGRSHISENANKMAEILLAQPRLITRHGSKVRLESPLQHLVMRGDQHLDWVKKLSEHETDFANDIYGVNAFIFSVEEQQYATAEWLLNISTDPGLVTRPRRNGSNALEMACALCEDLERGTALILAMLKKASFNIAEEPILYPALTFPNANPNCMLGFTRLLLEQGANPNVQRQKSEALISKVAIQYISAMKNKQRAQVQALTQVIKLLLSYNVDIFVEYENKMPLITYLASIQFGPMVIYLFSEHYKEQKVVLDEIDRLTNSNVIQSISSPSSSSSLSPVEIIRKFLYQISHVNEQQKQYLLVELWEKNNFSIAEPEFEGVKRSIYQELMDMFLRGTLAPSNILKLITVMDAMNERSENIQLFAYKEYIGESLEKIFSVEDKLALLADLCEKLVYLAKLLANYNEPYDFFKNELNYSLSRIIQLILLNEEKTGEYLTKILKEIEKINSEYYYYETRLVIMQLEIAHLYYTNNRKEFEVVLKSITQYLPRDHILLRQYHYWSADLLFNEAEKLPISDELVDVIQEKVNILKSTKIPEFQWKRFEKILKTIAKQQRRQVRKEKEVQQQVAIGKEKSASHVYKYFQSEYLLQHLNGNNNVDIILDKGFASNVDASHAADNLLLSHQLPFMPEKRIKRRNEFHYNEQCIQAYEKVKQNNTVLKPTEKEYTIEQIRDIFKDYIQKDELCKTLLIEKNKKYICWAICRIPANLPDIVTSQFIKEFEDLKGISPECGIYRLKLEGDYKDNRLHGQVVRVIGDRCFLIIFCKHWTHNQAFIKIQDKYISHRVEPNIPRLKHP